MYATPLTEYFVVPWSTTISTVSFLAIMYIALRNNPISFLDSILSGLSLGLTFAARYVDVVFLLPLALYPILKMDFRSIGKGKTLSQIAKASLGLLLFFVIVVGVLASHYYYFGSIFKTPYHLHGRPGTNLSDQHIEVYQPKVIMDHLFGQFINPNTFHAREMETIPKRLRTPLLERSFYLILAPIGIAYLMLRGGFLLLFPCLIGGILALMIYGMHPGTAPGCLQFHSLHYFKMWYPFLTIMSLVGLVQIGNYADSIGKEKGT